MAASSHSDPRQTGGTFGPTWRPARHGEFATLKCRARRHGMEPGMIPVQELPSDSFGFELGGRDDLEFRHQGDGAWQHDVALEMWIDATARPVSIRLAGVLDASTGANLVHVVEDCLVEGMREFVLDTTGLCIERTGWCIVEQVSATVRHAGGSVHLDTAPR